MRASIFTRGLGFTALASACSSIALAQTTLPLQSVTERERQLADTDGVRFGSFVLRPQAEGALTYDDNIYAGPVLGVDDIFVRTRVDLDLQSNFVRHGVNAQAYVDGETYFDRTGEDALQFGVGGGAFYDLGADTRLTAAAGYDHLAESRSNLNSARLAPERILYDTLHADAGLAHNFGPLETRVSGRVRSYDYDSIAIGGITINQDSRDFTVAEGALDLAYGVHGLTRFIAHGSYERRLYDIGLGDPAFVPALQVDRSAKGYRLEAGVERDVTELIQATLRIGYLHYQYDDPRISELGAFSYHADVVWNVTPLTTITAAAERRLDETVSPQSAGNLRDEIRLGARHELLRNLILLADMRHAHIRTVNTPLDSDEFEVGVGAHYYVGRIGRVEFAANHAQRTSADPAIEFRRNTVTIGFTAFVD